MLLAGDGSVTEVTLDVVILVNVVLARKSFSADVAEKILRRYVNVIGAGNGSAAKIAHGQLVGQIAVNVVCAGKCSCTVVAFEISVRINVLGARAACAGEKSQAQSDHK